MKKKFWAGLAVGVMMFCMAEVASATFLEYNGHSYGLTDIGSDWVSSQNQAVALGGHLVVINDANEQNFINNSFFTGSNEYTSLWIGLSDAQEEGNFKWVNGDPLTYTDWVSGEPNNSSGVYPYYENYVAANWHYANNFGYGAKGAWNDLPVDGFTGGGGDINYRGIIEIDTAQTPIPGAIWLLGSGLAGLIGARRKKK